MHDWYLKLDGIITIVWYTQQCLNLNMFDFLLEVHWDLVQSNLCFDPEQIGAVSKRIFSVIVCN